MRIKVIHGGLLTTVQDKGRWGYQAMGMPVAGAMDQRSLCIGNILSGNRMDKACLEITLSGPALEIIHGEGLVAYAGAELGLSMNGIPSPSWKALRVSEGDRISFSLPGSNGCRGYLCFSGGIDVPPVMGSRSTYLRGKIGGMEGRPLRSGDILQTGPMPALWIRTEGFECPYDLRPDLSPENPFRVIPGPQEDKFTDKGQKDFYNSVYTISELADRMGFRLTGTKIELLSTSDIISDPVPLGSIQVPGHGEPIVMMADRQTTGGYAKIAVMSSVDLGRLAQRLPGEKITFTKISFQEGLKISRNLSNNMNRLLRERARYRTQPVPGKDMLFARSGRFTLSANGVTHEVEWKKIDPD